MSDLTPIDSFKPDRRVTWTKRRDWSSHSYRGRVLRVTRAFVEVQRDAGGGDPVRLHANRQGKVELRPLTDHEIALEGWEHLRPTTTAVTIHREERGDRYYVRTDDRALHALAAHDALAKITDEVSRLGAWLAQRPAKPDGER